MINQLKSAFITLTRLPFIKLQDDDFDLKSSLWAFPVVGLVMALIVYVGVAILCMVNMPNIIIAILAVLLMTLLTGALHEDGLADCIDALGASSTERRLEIMRDSQIGTYGTLALIFSIAIRGVAIYLLLEAESLFVGLLTVLMVSRGAMVFIPILSPPARSDGLAAAFKNISKNQMLIGQFLIFLVGIFAIGTDIILLILVGVFCAFLIAQFAKVKIGGFTGDVLGATEQITQIIGFSIFLLMI